MRIGTRWALAALLPQGGVRSWSLVWLKHAHVVRAYLCSMAIATSSGNSQPTFDSLCDNSHPWKPSVLLKISCSKPVSRFSLRTRPAHAPRLRLRRRRRHPRTLAHPPPRPPAKNRCDAKGKMTITARGQAKPPHAPALQNSPQLGNHATKHANSLPREFGNNCDDNSARHTFPPAEISCPKPRTGFSVRTRFSLRTVLG